MWDKAFKSCFSKIIWFVKFKFVKVDLFMKNVDFLEANWESLFVRKLLNRELVMLERLKEEVGKAKRINGKKDCLR